MNQGETGQATASMQVDSQTSILSTASAPTASEKIKELVNSLDTNTLGSYEPIINSIREQISRMTAESLSESDSESRALLESGLRIWNVVLTKANVKGAVEAEIRLLACDVLRLSISIQPESGQVLQICRMLVITAQKWTELNNFFVASSTLDDAEDILRRDMHSSDTKEDDKQDNIFEKCATNANPERSLVCCMIANARIELELQSQSQEFSISISTFNPILALLDSIDADDQTSSRHTFANNCYRVASKSFDSRDFGNAENWLTMAFRTLVKCENHDRSVQARTLRLLAATHLEQAQMEKALSVIQLSLDEEDNSSARYLLIKIHLVAGKQSPIRAQSARESLIAFIQDPSISIDTAMNTANLASECDAAEIAIAGYDTLLNRIDKDIAVSESESRSPQATALLQKQFQNARLHKAQVLVSPAVEDYESAAKELELVVSGHLSGTSRASSSALITAARTSFEAGVHFLQSQAYDQAISWFRRSAPIMDEINQGDQGDGHDQTHQGQQSSRWRIALNHSEATCLIGLKEFDEAIELIKRTMQYEKSTGNGHLSAMTLFQQCMVHINLKNAADAEVTLKQLCQAPDYSDSLIDTISQSAKEQGLDGFAQKALEHAISTDQLQHSTIATAIQKLDHTCRMARSLLKMASGPNATTQAVFYSSKAIARLKPVVQYISSHSGIADAGKENLEAETSWQQHRRFFISHLWNLGLSTAKQRDAVGSKHLFKNTLSFIEMPAKIMNVAKDNGKDNDQIQGKGKTSPLSHDVKDLQDIRMCHFMITLGTVEWARDVKSASTTSKQESVSESESHTELHKQLQEAVDHIKAARNLSNTLRTTHRQKSTKADDAFSQLLQVAEVEILCILEDSRITKVVDQVISDESSPQALLEMMANACGSSIPGSPAQKASTLLVKACITRLKAKPSPDLNLLAQYQRYLILSTPRGTAKCMKRCEETRDTILTLSDSESTGYPLVEIMWLKSTTWNYGVSAYGQKQYKDAEKWMSIALSLLSRAPGNENHMMDAYVHVLDTVQPQQRQGKIGMAVNQTKEHHSEITVADMELDA